MMAPWVWFFVALFVALVVAALVRLVLRRLQVPPSPDLYELEINAIPYSGRMEFSYVLYRNGERIISKSDLLTVAACRRQAEQARLRDVELQRHMGGDKRLGRVQVKGPQVMSPAELAAKEQALGLGQGHGDEVIER